MITKKSLLITSLIALAISFNAVANKPIYKWKDGQGNVKYTQSKPPRGVEFEIIYQRQSNTQNQGKSEQTEKSDSSAEQDPITQSQDEIIAKQEQEKLRVKETNKEIRKKNCIIAKNNLETLEKSHRVFSTESGEKRLLTDQERADRLSSAKNGVKKYCK